MFIAVRAGSVLTLGLVVTATVSNAQVAFPTEEQYRQLRRFEIESKRTVLREEHRRLVKPARLVPDTRLYDVTYYRLELTLDPLAGQLTGTVEMRARAAMDNFQVVELDFDDDMTVDGLGGDADTSFYHGGNLLQMQLATPLQAGESFRITVDYRGNPEQADPGSFGFDFHDDDVPIIWTLSEPYGARSWWPCKDHPGDKADSVDILATVPDSLIVASNGTLRRVIDNGDGTRTFYWHEGYPIATYLVSLAISNYATWSEWFHYAPGDSMELQYYVFPSEYNQARSELSETLNVLAYFHDVFGPYPFLMEKYGIARFVRGGGMEHQTITSQVRYDLPLTVHELAHQWWGDKVTNATWGDIWLNEGFASYAEALYFEHARGREYYHTYMGYMDRDFPYPIYVDDTTSVSRIFNGTVYDKGAWFLHMLRHVVGDSTFFDILLAYVDDERFAYGSATTGGFQRVCETVSGMDLDWFFEPWMYQVGRPIYQALWYAEPTNSGYDLYLQLEQTQHPDQVLFPMPIDITIQSAGGDTTVTVFNDSVRQVFSISSSRAPTHLILDRDGWILKRINSVIQTRDGFQVPAEFALYHNYPNPFNPFTRIEFNLPSQSRVRLTVYDIRGREVATLVDGERQRGLHTALWRGIDRYGRLAAAGVYFYRLEVSDSWTPKTVFTDTRKMVLLR